MAHLYNKVYCNKVQVLICTNKNNKLGAFLGLVLVQLGDAGSKSTVLAMLIYAMYTAYYGISLLKCYKNPTIIRVGVQYNLVVSSLCFCVVPGVVYFVIYMLHRGECMVDVVRRTLLFCRRSYC